MRATTMVPLLLAAACADTTAPVCDLEACEATCIAQAGGRTLDATSTRLLTADEARRLRADLDDLRLGARLDGPGSGLCSGRLGCDTQLGRSPGPLEPGTYHLRVAYALPRRAIPSFWAVELYTSCVDALPDGTFQGAEEQLSTSRTVLTELTGAIDGPGFDVAADGAPRLCAWRAFLKADGVAPQQIEGRWRTPGAPTPRDDLAPAPVDSDIPAEPAAPAEAPPAEPAAPTPPD